MQYRNLGHSGLRVSTIGLGCNNFGKRIDLDGAREVIMKAIDLGITLFDTADIYGERGGSESAIGAVLGDERKRVILATKFGKPMADDGWKQGGSRRWMIAAVEDSLRRLKTNWIDLYQLHEPDPDTPIEETLRALDDLTSAGKIRYAGCSNMTAWRIVEAQLTAKSIGTSAFISVQNELSLVEREAEKELLPVAEKYGLGFLPFFPLASGLLTGKYRRGAELPAGARLSTQSQLANNYLNDRNWRIVDGLAQFCQARDRTLLELAFSWLLSKAPVASVIAGASNASQLEQNVKAGQWVLSGDELAEVDALTEVG